MLFHSVAHGHTASLVTITLALQSLNVRAVPVAAVQDSAPVMAARQMPYDAWNPPPSHFMMAHEPRGLVDDTLRGILGGLSVLPGIVQVSDLLVGDGKTSKGLLGTLGGLLLDVQPSDSTDPSSQDSGSDTGTASSSDSGDASNSTAADQAAQMSAYRYSLIKSTKQSSQVFLMPIQQNKATGQGGNDTAANATSAASGDQSPMLVKMLLHTLDGNGVPVVLCASYGATPPTELSVSSCNGDDDNPADASSAADANATATNDGSHSMKKQALVQVFKYSPSTGEVKPIFRQAEAEPETSSTDGVGNSTTVTTTEDTSDNLMRMHFKQATFAAAAATDDEGPSETTEPLPTATSPTSSASSVPSVDATGSAADPSATPDASLRITLGRLFTHHFDRQDDPDAADDGTADDGTADDGTAGASDGDDATQVSSCADPQPTSPSSQEADASEPGDSCNDASSSE